VMARARGAKQAARDLGLDETAPAAEDAGRGRRDEVPKSGARDNGAAIIWSQRFGAKNNFPGV